MKILVATLMLSAAAADAAAPAKEPITPGHDYHSYANTDAFRVRHLELELEASFEAKRLSGVVDLVVARVGAGAKSLTLDTRDLGIRQAWWVRGPRDLVPLTYKLGKRDPILGAPLDIELPAALDSSEFTVRIWDALSAKERAKRAAAK